MTWLVIQKVLVVTQKVLVVIFGICGQVVLVMRHLLLLLIIIGTIVPYGQIGLLIGHKRLFLIPQKVLYGVSGVVLIKSQLGIQ